jgi:hypothetical protein
MAGQNETPALAGARGSGIAQGDVQPGAYPDDQAGTRHGLIAANRAECAGAAYG